MAFGHDPRPAAPPELPIDTSIEAPVTNAPTTPPPTSAEPEPAEVQTPVATEIVPPTPNPHPPVAAPSPVATVEAPSLPGVPPFAPPIIDNGPLINPQPEVGTSPISMPGGSNGAAIPVGTPGLEQTDNNNSTVGTPINEPTITIIESREATPEEVEATINGLLETYPQYTEDELLAIATDAAHAGKITPDSLEELEVAVGAHDSGLVPGSLMPASNEKHDFRTIDVDGNIIRWDVKSLDSRYPYDLEGFLTKTYTKDIAKEGESIVFNTQNMNAEDIRELEQALIDDPRFVEGMYVLFPAG